MVVVCCVCVQAVAFGVPALVISGQQWGAVCSAASLPPLYTWLLVYGVVALSAAALLAPLVCCLRRPAAKALFLALLCAAGLFNFAWNIVGAVALFRDAPQCYSQNHSLWAMTLAVLIIQWIGKTKALQVTSFFIVFLLFKGMFINCCIGYRTR